MLKNGQNRDLKMILNRFSESVSIPITAMK